MGECILTRRGGKGGSSMPKFDYSGNYTASRRQGKNWVIKFLTSGVFTPKQDLVIDAFLVGGGATSSYAWGGECGGGSGYTKTEMSIPLQKNVEYPIVIGAGGASNADGGQTTAFGQTANGGKKGYVVINSGYFGGAGGSGGGAHSNAGGSDGGNGGGPQGEYYGGTGQGTTTREFGESGGELYAHGGNGKNYSGTTPSSVQTVNTGNGGGGSILGASGIVVIRNHA